MLILAQTFIIISCFETFFPAQGFSSSQIANAYDEWQNFIEKHAADDADQMQQQYYSKMK